MEETSEGHVESASEEEVTPAGNLGNGAEGGIDETRQQLVWEYKKIDEEIRHCGDGGHARAVACDVNRGIIADNETLPCFAHVSQNIAATMALLHCLSEATMPEDRRVHREIRMLLEHAVAQ